jgi:dTDP-4-amino-4,6-dideoxygalactose transaminase
MNVPVYKPLIEQSDLDAVRSVLEEAWLGHGKHVKTFENKISSFLDNNRRKVVAVSTGTSAAHLSLLVAGVKPGDEVILSSLNFVGVAQAISATGAKPVFCDVNDNDMTIDIKKAEMLINKKTAAIITLDYCSNQCDLDQFIDLGNKYKIRIIHDAAHSFGWRNKGRITGSFGDICFFSFDPIKCFTAIDAGAIILNDENEEKWLIEARTVGQSFDMGTYGENVKMEFKQVDHKGFRYHLSNVHAVLGINQLDKYKQISSSRRKTSEKYNQAFSDLDLVEPIGKNYDDVFPFIYVVRIKNKQRESLKIFLTENGVETHVHWAPIHWYKMYQSCERSDMSVTNAAGMEVLTLPLHSCMAEDESDYVIEKIQKHFK